MGLFDRFKKKPVPVPKAEPKAKKKTAKEIATENKEAYVDIVSVELDPENMRQGSFEIDWNDYFVTKLVRAGYKGKDDEQLVDQWFQDVCRHVVLETYEQYDANNPRSTNSVQKKDIGGGRTEVS